MFDAMQTNPRYQRAQATLESMLFVPFWDSPDLVFAGTITMPGATLLRFSDRQIPVGQNLVRPER